MMTAANSGANGSSRPHRRGRRTEAAPASAVHPGEIGGRYRPLSDHDVERIHATALDVLERIGIGEPIPEILDYALPRGAGLNDAGRLCFPRGLVEDLVAMSPASYVAYGVDPKHDHEVSGQRVYFCTSGEAVRIFDYATQTYRPSTLVDLYDAARLADRMQHIHNYGQPFIATEWSEAVYVHDINVAYAALAGTQKSFAVGSATVGHVDAIVSMFDAYLGREGAFLERPFCLVGGCPIVSPLRFGQENAEVLVRVAELGLTADIAVAPQAGATAPGALAGALVQCFAETLACLCVVNCVRPGAAINFGMWPFVSDLRTGAFSGGSGEEALLMAATAQLANHYGFITSVASGMTDSKTVDAQAGYEKGITTTAAALAGGNLVSVYPGILGSLIGQSFEGMVIDNDMLGNIARLVRGVEVNDDTLSYDVIHEAVYGIGHFLGSPQTVALMRTEYEYPMIADRQPPGAWEEEGRIDIYARAHERVRDILSTHYPAYISPDADARIRSAFPIKLDPKDMQPANGRW
jgi:trimethylamine---corrinoid protein Co-methyltransferase